MKQSNCITAAICCVAASFGTAVFAAGGDIDGTFANNGFAINAVDLVPGGNDTVGDLVVGVDDSVYQVGVAEGSQGWRHFIQKLNAQGGVDSSYGSSGMAFLPQADPKVGAYGALMGNGNVLVTTAEWDATNSRLDAVLRQYRPDGSLDAQSFGGAGQFVLSNFPGARLEYVSDLAIDSQSRIVLAGISARYPSLTLQMMVARILPNGTLDTSFGGGVLQGSPIPQFDTTLRGMRVLANDDIVVGGGVKTAYDDWDFALWKIKSTGATDTSFGNSGFQTVWFDIGGLHTDFVKDLEVRADGSIFAVGRADDSNGNGNIAIAMLTPSGQLDTNFGNQSPKNGRFHMSVGGGYFNEAVSVAKRANGSFIVALLIETGSNIDFGALQFTSQGYLDTGFGFLGLRQYSFNYGNDEEFSTSIVVDSQDRALIGGWAGYSNSDNDLMVIRLQP